MVKKKRVLLGMSGGTDSSVTAAILKNEGYEVIGVTFVFSDLETQNKQSISDVRDFAKKLKITAHVVDLRKEFEKKIVSRFIREYSEGKTPFPCAFCNPELKFYYLNLLAGEHGADYMSTGHYVNVTSENGLKYIAKGKDPDKDQSFFLWGLRKEIVDKLIFPLGNFHKTETRAFAAENGFHKISTKKDSLGICFIADNKYRNFLKYRGLTTKSGYFVDYKGNILGTHNGIINYTIGQRRGLGINLNKPVFVAEIRPKQNEIVLSEFDALYKHKIFLEGCHFIYNHLVNKEIGYTVKVRYRLQETACNVQLRTDGCATINLKEPVAMIAKGQTAVLYDGDKVVGGGFISGSE